ncbi:MAG: hypothetical protein ACTSQ8_24675 [Candidatus Helarchaeota archaeon]
MSLGIVIKGPEGLVIAADSRVTLGTKTPNGEIFHVNFDNARKLLAFNTNSSQNSHIGGVTYGQATLGNSNRTAHSFLPEFESSLPDERLDVFDFAGKLRDFFMDQWEKNKVPNYSGANMIFVVAGYNKDEHFGRKFLFEIPGKPKLQERNPGVNEYGITWGGQRGFVDRIIHGYDENVLNIIQKQLKLDDSKKEKIRKALRPLTMKMPLQVLPLQDCVDLAIFFIRTTIDAQRLTVGARGVGGKIEVATITRSEGFKFIQRKKISGEREI